MRGFVLAISVLPWLACALPDPASVRARLTPRESALVELRTVASRDGWFETKVAAIPETKSVEFEDDAYPLVFDLGAGEPIDCWVMREWKNPPWVLREFSSGLSEVHEIGGIESSRIVGIGADAVDGAIYMGVEWDLDLRTWLGPAPGSIHLLYAVKQGAGILCAKHEIGYRESFVGVFRSFVRNFQTVDAPKAPEFASVSVLSIDGRNYGLSIEVVTRDDEGDWKSELRIHMLLPNGPDSLLATSSYQTEWTSGRDRSLLAAYRDSFEDDEQVGELSLLWSAERKRWVVSGTHRGLAIEQDLDPGSSPASALAVVGATREALAAPEPVGQVLTTSIWSQVDPTRLTEATLRIDEILDSERARATSVVDSAVGEAIVERATAETLSLKVRSGSGLRVDFDRIHVQGTR